MESGEVELMNAVQFLQGTIIKVFDLGAEYVFCINVFKNYVRERSVRVNL